MTTQELRLGNLVYGISDRIETISEIAETTLTAYCGTLKMSAFKTSVSDFTPIPLTEEWLIKLGLEKGQFHHRFNLDMDIDNQKHFLEVSFPRNEAIDVIVYFDRSFYKHIKYVHQLQNLYFALTGLELKTEL